MLEKRKIKIIRKLVGISEAIRLILIYSNIILIGLILIYSNLILIGLNSSILHTEKKLICLCKNQIKTDELHSLNTCSIQGFENDAQENVIDNHTYSDTSKFNEWLAALIDGNGYFILTKKGYASCEICMDARDKKVLYLVKHKYGGTIKPV